MSESWRERGTGRALVVSALALAAAACGGDFTGADDGLRPSEAGELATVMAEQTSRVFLAQVVEAPDPSAGVEISSQVLFDRGAACPGGGSAAVTGSVGRSSSVGDDRMTLDFSASLVHDSCAVRVGGRNVTVAGDPAVGLEALFERRGAELAGPQETRLEGRIRWSGRRGSGGSCRVDLTTTVSAIRGSLTTSGRVCGIEVDRTVDISSPGSQRGDGSAGPGREPAADRS